MPVLPRPEELIPEGDDQDTGCGAVVALIAGIVILSVVLLRFMPLFFPR